MNPATLPATRGRSSYAGFRSVIKAVGTGRRGSRSLSLQEAHAAVGALLAGEVSPAQAGAFLVALRIKGETPEELAGAALALRDAVRGPQARSPERLVASAGAYDGMAEAPHLSLAAAVVAAAAGARVVVHCAQRLGPKHGTTPAEVLAALGGPVRPTPAQSLAMLERSGVGLVHAGEALAGYEALAGLREEIGLRSALHTAEKLVGHLGARRFVVGHTHSSYRERILGALELLGADAAVAVRGIEGSDLVRAARPGAAAPAGPLDLPELPGLVLRGDADPAVAAALTRAICSGDDHGAAEATVVLSAAVRLQAAGCCDDPREGVRRAREAIASGRAGAVLDALVA